MSTAAITSLRNARDALAAKYEALVSDATLAGGKPNAGGGASADHMGYRAQLWRELMEIDKAIAAMASSGADYGEVTSEAR